MHVFVVLKSDPAVEGDKIAGIFLDPLKAEEYRAEHNYKIIETHALKDVEKLRIMTAGGIRMMLNDSDLKSLKEKGTLV